jgi:flagellar biosynthetic protein FliR
MPLSLFDISEKLFLTFLLLLARVLGILLVAPLFNERRVPVVAKMGLATLSAFLLLPVARVNSEQLPDTLPALGWASGQEFLLGALIGFLLSLLFAAIQWAAYLLDFQMGFGFVSVADPLTGAGTSVLGQFLGALGLLTFLALNGHHVALRALGYTLEAVPLGQAAFKPQLLPGLVVLLQQLLSCAIRIVTPTLLILLFIDVAMGLIGRVIPQMNIFLVTLPIKILVGLLTLGLTLPVLEVLMSRLMWGLERNLKGLLS